MKVRTLLVAAAMAFASSTYAAGNHAHGHDHKPLHGGVVVESSDREFELVAKTDVITLYVRDHGKAASTQGATTKLTLLHGAQKSEVALLPAGDNKLEAKGNFKVGAGAKAVALVALQGKKPINVRFALK